EDRGDRRDHVEVTKAGAAWLRLDIVDSGFNRRFAHSPSVSGLDRSLGRSPADRLNQRGDEALERSDPFLGLLIALLPKLRNMDRAGDRTGDMLDRLALVLAEETAVRAWTKQKPANGFPRVAALDAQVHAKREQGIGARAIERSFGRCGYPAPLPCPQLFCGNAPFARDRELATVGQQHRLARRTHARFDPAHHGFDELLDGSALAQIADALWQPLAQADQWLLKPPLRPAVHAIVQRHDACRRNRCADCPGADADAVREIALAEHLREFFGAREQADKTERQHAIGCRSADHR